MPAFIPPIIVGGLMAAGRIGASAAARQAARAAARSGTRAASGTAARSGARSTARGASSGARGVAKKTAAKKPAAKTTTSTKTSRNQYIDKASGQPRTPGFRTAKTPDWVASYGKKKPSQTMIKVGKKDIANTKRLQEFVASKPKAKSKMSKKKKAAIGAGVAGGLGLAYATKPKNLGAEGPTKRSPVSSTIGGKKRKNVVQQSSAIRFRG
jgi:hypothetical protein